MKWPSRASGLVLALAAIASLSAHAATAPAPRRPSLPPHATSPGPRRASPPAHAPGGEEAALARDTLAWVGDRAITALDLVQRIEWMPWPEKRDAASMDQARLRGVQSLIAEALLARENERRSPNGSPALARARAALRRALARDALSRVLGEQAPPPTPAEIDRLAKAMHPELSPAKRAEFRRLAADSLRELASELRTRDFMMSQLAGKRVDVDSTTFMALSDSLRRIVLAADTSRVPGGGILIPSESPDILLAMFAGELERTLAHLPDGPLTLGDALEDMRFYTLAVRSVDPRVFPASFSLDLRVIVEGEMMAREALRRRMDERPEVRHDLATWTQAWRARGVLESVAAGPPIADDEAFQALALHEPELVRKTCEVDLEEILSPTSQEASDVRRALDGGARLDSLAARRTHRTEWVATRGRSGWFAIPRHLELGYLAMLSPRDSLVGPIHLPEGWSNFRVLGKRLGADSLRARESLERERQRVEGDRRTERAARYVASLAEGVPIRIDEAAVRKVDILPSNMVVKRSLGFGGGMTAAPTLTPLWQWMPAGAGGTAPRP